MFNVYTTGLSNGDIGLQLKPLADDTRCRIQEIATPARGVTSTKFSTRGSRRDAATVLYCGSNQRLKTEKQERTSNVAPLSTQRPFRMTAQINNSWLKHTMFYTSCPVKVKQLALLCGLHARSGKFAYTKGGGEGFQASIHQHIYDDLLIDKVKGGTPWPIG